MRRRAYGVHQLLMKTSSAKAKGRTFQQWVRDKILNTFPRLTKDDVRSTSMGAAGEDILLSGLARERFPYAVECKSRHSIAVYSWLDQRAGGDYKPIVFAKANHREPIVILYAEDFMKLFHE
jgi:hypothetical protein